jgi:hypothetical protein
MKGAKAWKGRGTTLEAVLDQQGPDNESVLALRDPVHEVAGQVKALMSERRRLEGMGYSCK